MYEDLSGRRVLITGSSTGIGAAVARGFAKMSAIVTIHYNSSKAEAEKLAEELRARGCSIHVVAGDVSRQVEARRVVEEAAELMGGLDVLINNAGGLVQRAPLADLDEVLYDSVLDLNVRSVVTASQTAVKFLERSEGCIINTSSVAARNGGGPGALLYAGAKAFVLNATRNMAKELAPKKIRVNGVSPGVIATPFHERYSTPEIIEGMRKTIALGYVAKPEECVGAYMFFASRDASAYITGQTLEVNGGQFMV